MTGLTFLLWARVHTVQRLLLKWRAVQLIVVMQHELRIRDSSQNFALPRIPEQFLSKMDSVVQSVK